MKNKILGITLLMAICLMSVSVAQAGCSEGICCDKDLWAKLSENEVHTARANNIEYEIEVLVISETSNEAKFKINGEITDALSEGEEDTLADGSVIEVKKIITDESPSKVIICFDYGILHCSGIVGELTDGETENYVVGNYEYEVEASVYQGNFRLQVNGEYTDWLGIGSEQTMADGLKIKVLDIGGDHITFCMTPGSEPTTQAIPTVLETSKPKRKIDLSNYPDLFINGKSLNTDFVVGDQAPADDVIAAIDISVSFQKYGVSKTGGARLASEISNYNRNIISIGRPCDNAVTAQILRTNGISDYDSDCSYDLRPGQAVVYLFDYNGYAHMLVFGYSRLETRQAARALTFQKMKGRKQLLEFGEGMPVPETTATEQETCWTAVEQFKREMIEEYDSKGLPIPEDIMKKYEEMHARCAGARTAPQTYDRCISEYESKAREQQITWQNYPEADRIRKEGLKVCGEKFGMPIPGPSRPAEEIAECMKEIEKFKRELVEKYDNKGIPIPEDLMKKYNEMRIRCTNEIITPERTAPPVIEDRKEDCPGCRKNGACMQIGIRFLEGDAPVYCDIDHAFKPQKQNSEVCMNNYECLSNTCSDGVCQSMGEQIKGIQKELAEQKGILEKIMGFFKRIFG
ncbi:hypothetical protein KY338_02420 [Candidatus Woesearchaeota archaeon]|nr:hypothetical protein [Candidatus Woesearchaeota archaeon]MBW3005929.1 hypothetical protein [Candidatus Woesearchaeota archaeon]